MTHYLKVLIFLYIGLLVSCTKLPNTDLSFAPPLNTDRDRLFDEQWLFSKGENLGAEMPDYDDTGWRQLTLPHDWSIEDLGKKDISIHREKWLLEHDGSDSLFESTGPFVRNSPGAKHTGYTLGGSGWYRKHFRLEESDRGKQVGVLFDGVYMNSNVYINGQHLGNHPYGYTAFYFDLTPFLRPIGEDNVIAVEVKNEGVNSRWYSGSGIYRHVWLRVTHPVHIDLWGVQVTTPEISPSKAEIQVSTRLANNTELDFQGVLRTRIVSQDGKPVCSAETAISLAPESAREIGQKLEIRHPVFWDPDHPQLYTAHSELLSANNILDRNSTLFGIRSLDFNADSGFLLNGKPTLLRGGCLHHDHGMLGAAAYDRAEIRVVELLKSRGFNAIRTAHNPPSTSLLDACDRLGMLVIEEAFDMWEHPKNKDDYHRFFPTYWDKDISAMVMRDRNHPSVIIWSFGNEVHERANARGIELAGNMISKIRELDNSRPVTQAICGFWDHPGVHWDSSATAFALTEVQSYNYEWRQYERDHQMYPMRIMLGSESFPIESWDNWRLVEQHPYLIGDFVWTAMDYMGETGIGHTYYSDTVIQQTLPWPWYNAFCGDIDLTGHQKPQSLYRDVLWGLRDLVLLVREPVESGKTKRISRWGWPDELPSWNWAVREGDTLEVVVYTRMPGVRIELNGKAMGEEMIADTSRLTAHFRIPYIPGSVKAFGLDGAGRDVVSDEIHTVGRPVALRLTADRGRITHNPNDLSYITAEVVDKQGRVVPDATVEVRFGLTGPGNLLAAGNADPTGMMSFRSGQSKTWRGRCAAIVQPAAHEATGIIRVTAEATGLGTAEITISTFK